ncbi:MAG: hypothetical protein MZV65_48295 [Chromatiales bacterium]|nr:hypothetical protein [Chromatiales bacterium]
MIRPPRKPIPPAERLIVALDVPTAPEPARALVAATWARRVRFYKIGLELFMAGGYFELLDWLVGAAARRCSSTSSSSTSRKPCAPRCSSWRGRGATLRHRAWQPGDHGGGGRRQGRRQDPRGHRAHQPRPRRPRRSRLRRATSRSWCCPARAARSRRAATASFPRASRRP